MTDWIEGQIDSRIQWNATHFSLRIACERSDFVAGQFVQIGMDIDGKRVTRPYSCVNPPDQPGVEILFNTVPEGSMSNRLAELQPGDPILLGAGAKGLLTLHNVPPAARDLWLLATGTGAGPFLSILQTEEPWQRFERVTLVYGARHLQDICYPQLLDQLLQQQPARLRVIPCITRDNPQPGYNGRITQALQEGHLETLAARDIDPDFSHFMLCGNQSMISEVTEILQARGLRRHLRGDPGQISSEKYH